MTTFFELTKREPPSYLPIEQLKIEKNAINMIYGDSGSYKSFLALGIALQMAVKGTDILYVSGEGTSGYIDRYLAWCAYHKITDVNIGHAEIHETAVNLLYEPSIDDFTGQYIERGFCPDLVIFDTLNSCIPGKTDSGDDTVSTVINHCNQIMSAFNGCTIILIHHKAKAANSNDPRGSGGWFAGVNTAIETEKIGRDDMFLTVSCTKQKNAECFGTKFYAAEKVSFYPPDASTWSDERSSLVLVPADMVKIETNSIYSDNEKQVMAALFESEIGLQKKDILSKVTFPDGSFFEVIKSLVKKSIISSAGKRPKLYSLSQRGSLEYKKNYISE